MNIVSIGRRSFGHVGFFQLKHFVGVVDPAKEQPLWWRGRAGQFPVAAGQNIIDPFERPFATTDLQHCADEVADHVVKETFSIDFKAPMLALQFRSGWSGGDARDPASRVNGSDSGRSFGAGSLERFEVMTSDKFGRR
mgnify:CR=1 FL=1